MKAELDLALGLARQAGEHVMGVYAAPFQVDFKVGDDPVTRADREANALICERLARETPGVPIVAEESAREAYAGYERSPAAWFVDPLDGTREFVARNGEFCVLIGLARGGRAVLGVLVAPAWGRAFAGIVGEGAWEIGPGGVRTPIRVSQQATLAGASLVCSRLAPPPHLAALVAATGIRRAVGHGSCGLKSVLVATGVHDAYVQPGRDGCRWDSCASEALVRGAGGELTEADGAPFDYASGEIENRRGLVASNGRVHAEVVRALSAHA